MMNKILPAAVLFAFAAVSCADEPKSPEPVKIEVAEKHLGDGAQLLDVRTKEEWDEGHLQGAKLVTVTEDGFMEKAKAKLDAEKPVVVYCHSGKRSAMAAKKLRAAGYTILEIEGGISAWVAAGKPVVK